MNRDGIRRLAAETLGLSTSRYAFAESLSELQAVAQTDIRLFGKPESFVRRRMGVALAYGDDIGDCRLRAKQAAACVKTTKPS